MRRFRHGHPAKAVDKQGICPSAQRFEGGGVYADDKHGAKELKNVHSVKIILFHKAPPKSNIGNKKDRNRCETTHTLQSVNRSLTFAAENPKNGRSSTVGTKLCVPIFR